MRNRENRGRGFTLLEVLAAVALLIVLFIPLVRVAIDGLRSEGVSRRRLEASLIADEALAVIEAGLLSGDTPTVGEQTEEDKEYQIVTRVTSYDHPFSREEKNERGRRRDAVPSLFPASNSREESPLRQIEIRVSWPDGENVREVVRTTFAFDLAAAEAKLSELNTEGALE